MELLDSSQLNSNKFEIVRKRLIMTESIREYICSHFVKGKDKGRECWHLLYVDSNKISDFFKKTKSGSLDCKDYGRIIDSGWGWDVPDEKRNLSKIFLEELKSHLCVFRLKDGKIYYTLCHKRKDTIVHSNEFTSCCERILYSSLDEDPVEVLSHIIEQKYFKLQESVTAHSSKAKAAIEAARKGDVTCVRKFLTTEGNVNWRDKNGWTMLHHAVHSGNLNMIKFLKSLNIDAQVKDELCGRKPLHITAKEGNVESIGLLLEFNGCGVDDEDYAGWTPLHYASWKGKSDAVLYLISKGAKVHVREATLGKKPVHVAATEGHKDIVQIFLDKGVDINEVDAQGRTLLYHSALTNRFEMASFLMDKNANIDIAKDGNRKSIHACAEFDSVQIAKELLNRGTDINSQDDSGWTPLHAAAANRAFKLTRLLVERGADINVLNKDEKTPFDLAVDSSHTEIASYLAGILSVKLNTNYEDVLKIKKKLLDMQKNRLGNDHEDTVNTQKSVEMAIRKQELWKRVLEEFIDNPNKLADVSCQFDNLCTKYLVGKTYLTQSKYKDAKGIFKEVHDAWQVSLGARHPLTLDVLSDLASAHLEIYEYHEASEIFEDILEKRKSTSSDANHPDNLQTMKDLAFALANKGENKRALVLFKELLAKSKASLGADHPDTQLIAFHIDIVEKKIENSSENVSCRLQ